jgi:glycosyltransferase involved in cell wall biosynthesis
MAYSLGIPVVCTDVGGLAEMVEDGRTGYVVPPKDPQAIADAVAKCLEGDNLAKMSDHAQQVAVEQYSWEKIAEQTADIYHHLAGVE